MCALICFGDIGPLMFLQSKSLHDSRFQNQEFFMYAGLSVCLSVSVSVSVSVSLSLCLIAMLLTKVM